MDSGKAGGETPKPKTDKPKVKTDKGVKGAGETAKPKTDGGIKSGG
jgi:hypothetical protein